MDTQEIRQAFLDYFKSKDHTIVDSSSLVPNNDPTLLFTNAGMVQFKESLALRENRGYTRAASCQRCIRAGGKHNDLDNVGYTARHHTFFEMLGNFSFGDYFKEGAILFAWEFLTEAIGLPEDRLWVTVHQDDDEAEKIWTEKAGFDPARITRLGDDDNFWTMGDTGPCGPSSEIFYDHGPGVPGGPPGSPEGDLDRYIEIWNLVFTQYDRSADGVLTPLPRPCVDTGMGLERLAAVLQDVHDNYDIDLFQALIKQAAALLGVKDLASPSLKVIADHIRSAVFLVADGVLPSNEGRGYVLRRIIRRALRHGHKLQSAEPFFHKLTGPLVKQMGEAYPLIEQTRPQIEKILLKEEEQFELTLDQGMKILGDAIKELSGKEIPGEVAFKLYDTYGFPADLTADIARERDLTIDMAGFDREMEAQRKRAKAASQFAAVDDASLNLGYTTAFVGYESLEDESEVLAILRQGERVDVAGTGQVTVVLDRTPFYAESGGQVGDMGTLDVKARAGTAKGAAKGVAKGVAKEAALEVTGTIKRGDTYLHLAEVREGEIRVGDRVTARVDRKIRDATRLNHSATHLMHAALRQILGEHVNQRGSLVNAAHLRFDFSHFEALPRPQVREIERLVNDQIRRNTEIETEIMPLEAAREKGAMALFGEKYSEEVRVLTMGNGFSIELCGGTHASRTGDIGLFRIISEQGVASGVRRIEARTGQGAMEEVERMEDQLGESAALVKADRGSLTTKIEALLERNKKLEKSVSDLNRKLADGGQSMIDAVIDLGEFKLLVNQLDGADPASLPAALDRLKQKLGSGIVVLGTVNDGKVGLIAGVTKELTDRFNAGDLVNHVASQVGGKGGGRPDMARAGGNKPDALPAALESVEAYVKNLL